MNKLLKGSLAAVVTAAVAVESLRRAKDFGTRRRYQPWERAPYKDFEKRVLIIGGGFAGYAAAKTLCTLTRKRDDVGVMVVSRENFFTFWPMLAGIISSDIDTKNVAQPLRRALIGFGASFRRAELEEVDFERQGVRAGGKEFPYDHVVLALGGEPAYFGIPGVEEHCLSMKGIGDAERIRNRVIECFEEVTLRHGEIAESKLTFVVIGGGATGVETAAELHALIHKTLAPDYPNIDSRRARIILVESNKEILKELDPALRRAARARLAEHDIEVINNVRAKEVTADRVILDNGREIETETVVWTAGGRASVKLEDLAVPLSGKNGVEVDPFLRVPGWQNVWAIGDCAAVVGADGEPVPPNAQAAVQQGEALGRNVLAAINGEDLAPFEYKPLGQLVELGNSFAVNEVRGVKFSGLLAALFWRATYLYKLESPQNQARVAVDWFMDLFFHSSVTQIRGRE
jgi:NADH dehydrogenase